MSCFVSTTYLEQRRTLATTTTTSSKITGEDIVIRGRNGRGIFIIELSLAPISPENNVIQMPERPWFGKIPNRMMFTDRDLYRVGIVSKDRRISSGPFLRYGQKMLLNLISTNLEELVRKNQGYWDDNNDDDDNNDNNFKVFYSENPTRILLTSAIKLFKNKALGEKIFLIYLNTRNLRGGGGGGGGDGGGRGGYRAIRTGPIDCFLNKGTDLCPLHDHSNRYYSNLFYYCTMHKLKVMAAAGAVQYNNYYYDNGIPREDEEENEENLVAASYRIIPSKSTVEMQDSSTTVEEGELIDEDDNGEEDLIMLLEPPTSENNCWSEEN